MNKRVCRKQFVQGMVTGIFVFSRRHPQVRAECKPKRRITVEECRPAGGIGRDTQGHYRVVADLQSSGLWGWSWSPVEFSPLGRFTTMVYEPGQLAVGPGTTIIYDAEQCRPLVEALGVGEDIYTYYWDEQGWSWFEKKGETPKDTEEPE
jgi:hypothetical protein